MAAGVAAAKVLEDLLAVCQGKLGPEEYALVAGVKEKLKVNDLVSADAIASLTRSELMEEASISLDAATALKKAFPSGKTLLGLDTVEDTIEAGMSTFVTKEQLAKAMAELKAEILAERGGDPEEAFVNAMKSLVHGLFNPIKEAWSVLIGAIDGTVAHGPRGWEEDEIARSLLKGRGDVHHHVD